MEPTRSTRRSTWNLRPKSCMQPGLYSQSHPLSGAASWVWQSRRTCLILLPYFLKAESTVQLKAGDEENKNWGGMGGGQVSICLDECDTHWHSVTEPMFQPQLHTLFHGLEHGVVVGAIFSW